MKSKFTILTMALALSVGCSNFTYAAPAEQPKMGTACDLKSDMRNLWEDHIQWTRNVILNVLDDLPGTSQAVARLLKNQEDIGNAIKPFYGEAAGNQLTTLLKEHITVAADLLTALKTDNTAAFNTANAQWIANADAIATFLSSANPNWPVTDMKEMMHSHLNLTAAEALARKQHNYAADVMAYDNVQNEILEMADMLTVGIVKQFPNKFSGCGLREIMQHDGKPVPCDLETTMAKLWEDHITWTRNVILNVIDDLPGTTEAVNRLLQNQVDIGNALKPYYGTAAGDQVSALLTTHITTAATLLTALKNNDQATLSTANAAWYSNADDIARALSSLNPAWSYAEMKKMMDMHLDLTKNEAVARKTANYDADIAAYDDVHHEILEMADMLSEGVVQQFRNQFSGCPLTTGNGSMKPGVLQQNSPNPFSNNTVISFNLPSSIGKAQLIIADESGFVVKTFMLTQRGQGNVMFDGSLLRSGVYSYSIIADGQVLESRKMLHQ